MGKHDKDNFEWKTPKIEPVVINYDPPKDEYYKARISALEKENAKLHEKLEQNANFYGMGKETFEKLYKEVSAENDRLRDKIMRLEQALIREAIRDVQV